MIILIYVLIDIFIIMAVRTEDLLTIQQLYDNYEFKVIKKIIMREFPWIKDVTVDGDSINQYNLIFVILDINPFELSDIIGHPVYKWALNDIEHGESFSSSYLSSVMNISYEESKPITDQIEEIFTSVHKSIAIPKELKLPEARRLAIGDFKTLEGLTIPPNYVDWRRTIKFKNT
jgi:hypothetical protein